MNEQMNNYMPSVIERSGNGERFYDIYSRLLKDRIIFVDGEINDYIAKRHPKTHEKQASQEKISEVFHDRCFNNTLVPMALV